MCKRKKGASSTHVARALCMSTFFSGENPFENLKTSSKRGRIHGTKQKRYSEKSRTLSDDCRYEDRFTGGSGAATLTLLPPPRISFNPYGTLTMPSTLTKTVKR